jgi:high-affinity K+ transport system ATPase subunit B
MTKSASLFQKDLMREAFKHSFVKLNPIKMYRNPVMFTVGDRNRCYVFCLLVDIGR